MKIDESKEDIIKIFEVKDSTSVGYIINTILNILNRWNSIKIYIFNKKLKNKKAGKKK